MNVRYLIDENLDPLFKTQLLIKKSGLIVYAVGDPGSPSRGTPDSEILCWCEENSFVLVTNNRKSMPAHLGAHLVQGRHVPGIITLNAEMSVGEIIEELILYEYAIKPTTFYRQRGDAGTYPSHQRCCAATLRVR